MSDFEVTLTQYVVQEQVVRTSFPVKAGECYIHIIWRIYALHNMKPSERVFTLWVREAEVNEVQFEAKYDGWATLATSENKRFAHEFLKPGYSILLEKYDYSTGNWIFSGNLLPPPISNSSPSTFPAAFAAGIAHGMSEHRSVDMAAIHLAQERQAQAIRDREEEEMQRAIALSLQESGMDEDVYSDHLMPGGGDAVGVGAPYEAYPTSRKTKSRDFLDEDRDAERAAMGHGVPDGVTPMRSPESNKTKQIEIIDIDVDSIYLEEEEAKEALSFRPISFVRHAEIYDQDDFYEDFDCGPVTPLMAHMSDGEDADSGEGGYFGCS